MLLSSRQKASATRVLTSSETFAFLSKYWGYIRHGRMVTFLGLILSLCFVPPRSCYFASIVVISDGAQGVLVVLISSHWSEALE